MIVGALVLVELTAGITDASMTRKLHIPQQRSRFMDFFEAQLAHLLALLGAEPRTICALLAARSEEYSVYLEWVSKDTDKMAGTLFWNATKRIGAPIGFDRNFLFTLMFGTLFLGCVQRALAGELLTGNKINGDG
jgi:hypothetical protein